MKERVKYQNLTTTRSKVDWLLRTMQESPYSLHSATEYDMDKMFNEFEQPPGLPRLARQSETESHIGGQSPGAEFALIVDTKTSVLKLGRIGAALFILGAITGNPKALPNAKWKGWV